MARKKTSRVTRTGNKRSKQGGMDKPSISFAFTDDSDLGMHRVPPREPGEVREWQAEYLHPEEGGWSDVVFIEDDNGFRWVDVATQEVHPVTARPGWLTQYYYRLPWEVLDEPDI